MERKAMQTEAGTGHEGDCCACGEAVLDRLSQILGVVLGALLHRASRMALILVMGVAVVLCATGLGLAQLAASPWPMRGHDTRHSGQSPYKGPWKPALKWKFLTEGDVYSSPAIGLDGTVYVGSYDGYLYAVSPGGSLMWKFQTGSSVESSPAIGLDGTVYVGSKDRHLYAVKRDGTLKWKFLTEGDVYSSPAIGLDGTVYVGSYDGYLYAVNPDGTLKWKFLTGDVYSSPAIGLDGTIYVGSGNHYFYALNPDGGLKWKFKTGKYVWSSPAIGLDGTVYVGSTDKYLYAVNPEGALKWKLKTSYGVRSSPAIGLDGTVYVGSGNHYFYALNPDGSRKWVFTTFPFRDRASDSPAIGSDGTVYVGLGDLYALNPDAGLKWKFKTGKYVRSSPVIGLDGTVYVGSDDNYLYALEEQPNVSPILYAGRVLPETGHEQTEFVFSVTYMDADNDAPSKITVKIDNEAPKTMTRRQGDDSFVNGELYEYRTKLSLGDHTFSFAASDGVADATGDLALHPGPTVGKNTPPVLSNGTVWPQTGTRGTEVRFAVIYSDLNNDPPAELTVRIDSDAAQPMSAVGPADRDYTDGSVYEYKTKLSAGTHTYAFAATDWSANATGNAGTHSGPTIVASGSPPVLSNGNVTPQTSRSETEFTFEVLYADPDDEPPSEITVEIDGEAKAMVPAVPGDTSYAEGVLYQYKTTLGLASHTYSFAAQSGSRVAVGDTVSHSGPLVSTVPQEWRGATDQGRSVSFTVSGDGTSILDLQTSVGTYLEITITTEEGTTTEYYNETISGTIPQMSVYNNKFSGSITESVPLETLTGTATGTARANISGTFTSPTRVEGTFSGFYPEIVFRPGPWGPVLQQLTLMGSGEWSASLPSSIVIHQPKDRVLLNSSSVKVSGVAEGGLVHSAEINGTPVQLTKGRFSTNVLLAEGANAIHLIAFDADKNIVGTYSVRVTLDSTPPVVTIAEPTDSLETSDPSVTIKGTVDDPSVLYVNVNDVPICVVEGQFSTDVFLRTGVNTILVNASDEVGNLGSTQITVVRTVALPGDFNEDGEVGLSDFSLFVKHYGQSEGHEDFDALYDLDGDGRIGLSDFSLFVQNYGKRTSLAKAVPMTVGKHRDASLSMVTDGAEEAWRDVHLVVRLDGVRTLKGYSFKVQYDPDRFDFREAKRVHSGSPNDRNRLLPLLVVPSTPGEVLIADVVGGDAMMKGGGALVELRFKRKGAPQNARFVATEGAFLDAEGEMHALESAEAALLPQAFALLQNFPNPFNAHTTIRYQLPRAGRVQLSIYNVLGQKIRTLVDGVQPAAFYVVRWDGKDQSGADVASGIYLYRLTGGHRSLVRKMLLLR